MTLGFEGRVEFNYRRLGKNILDGGISVNIGLEMGVFGFWEGFTGWLEIIGNVVLCEGMCILVGMYF